MDEEENFARLLSASTPAPKPQWGTPDDSVAADPWANPFADADAGSGWGEPGISSFQPSTSTASAPAPESPEQSVHDLPPDPPSVIAARERAELEGASGGFGSGGFGGGFDEDPYAPSPFGTPAARSPTKSLEPAKKSSPVVSQKHIPAGLIDEELLNESDPSVSLKKAFVKHNTPAGTSSAPATPDKKYVFKPKDKPVLPALPPAKKEVNPASIPLPESIAGTPTTSRPETPTLSTDRVNISPLETPTGETEKDFGFQSLAIGSSGMNGSSSPTAGRFGGRGWGAIEADDTPLTGSGDPWNEGGSGGWNNDSATKEESDDDSEDNAPLRSSERPGSGDSTSSPDRRAKRLNTPMFQITVSDPTKVGDPVRGHVVYTVKTRTTSPHYRRGDFSVLRRYSDFLWLFEQLCANNPGVIVPPIPDKHPFGRFQDQFIETRRAALQRALGKMTSHPILQLDPDLRLFLESESFAMDIKNRRSQTPESTSSSGLLGSWTGPKYVEQDDWFDQRKAYLDHLETQLKGISKSLDIASKARLDMADSLSAFSDSTFALSESDLGAAMCTAFKKLSDLVRREKEMNENQAKDDVSKLLNLSDEYIRFIQSVRLAFASRVKAYHYWQSCEKEVNKVRSAREKQRLAGRAGGSGHEVGEVSSQLYYSRCSALTSQAERRARDAAAEFEAQSKLVKAEFARFERERVDEFRTTLSNHLDDQIRRQRDITTAWEDYHAMLLKMVQRAQAQQQAQAEAQAQARAAAAAA